MSYPTNGIIRIVNSDQVETLTGLGWRVIDTYTETVILCGSNQEHAPVVPGQTYNSPPVYMSKSYPGEARRFVMFQEKDSMADQLQSALDHVRKIQSDKNTLTKELADEKKRGDDAEAKTKLTQATVDALQRTIADQNVKLRDLANLLKAAPTYEADRALLIAELGIDRARRVLGPDLVDPNPPVDGLAPTGYERLVED